METAMKQGLEDIKKELGGFGQLANGWRISTTGFGDRQMNGGNWLLRAAAAMGGIYGNDAAEALYPLLAADSDGNKPDCSANKYTLTFPAGVTQTVNGTLTLQGGTTINTLLSLRSSTDGAGAHQVQRGRPALSRPEVTPVP